MAEVSAADLTASSAHLRALAHPARMHLLSLLHERDRTFGELQQASGLAANLTTYHLTALRRAGLVSASRESGDRRVTRYALAPERLVALCATCAELAAPLEERPAFVAASALEGAGPALPADSLLDVLASCGDPVVALAPPRGIVLWNTPAERLLGWRANEVLGRECTSVLQCHDTQGRQLCVGSCPMLARARRRQPISAQDLRVSDASGATRWVNVTTIAISDEYGGLCNVVHILRDISRDKSLERFVQTLRREATAALAGADADPTPARDVPAASLTLREREVLVLLADGADTATIATRLCVGRSTARKHVQSILGKFGVHRRLEALAHAYRHGLLPNRQLGA